MVIGAVVVAVLGALATAAVAPDVLAKKPGARHCYKSVCVRVRTIGETERLVGQTLIIRTSHYGDPSVDRFNRGKYTSNGERFRATDGTRTASADFPDGTELILRNPENGRVSHVRVNDFGPFKGSRRLDVTQQVARDLGFFHKGVVDLEVTVLAPPPYEDRVISYQRNRKGAVTAGYIGIYSEVESVGLISRMVEQKQHEHELARQSVIALAKTIEPPRRHPYAAVVAARLEKAPTPARAPRVRPEEAEPESGNTQVAGNGAVDLPTSDHDSSDAPAPAITVAKTSNASDVDYSPTPAPIDYVEVHDARQPSASTDEVNPASPPQTAIGSSRAAEMQGVAQSENTETAARLANSRAVAIAMAENAVLTADWDRDTAFRPFADTNGSALGWPEATAAVSMSAPDGKTSQLHRLIYVMAGLMMATTAMLAVKARSVRLRRQPPTSLPPNASRFEGRADNDDVVVELFPRPLADGSASGQAGVPIGHHWQRPAHGNVEDRIVPLRSLSTPENRDDPHNATDSSGVVTIAANEPSRPEQSAQLPSSRSVALVNDDTPAIEVPNPTPFSSHETLIGEGVIVESDIASDEAVRILGDVEGNISGARVEIGATGFVTGHIAADHAVVSGQHYGNMDVSELTVHETAVMFGNARVEYLSVDAGATVEVGFKFVREAQLRPRSDDLRQPNDFNRLAG